MPGPLQAAGGPQGKVPPRAQPAVPTAAFAAPRPGLHQRTGIQAGTPLPSAIPASVSEIASYFTNLMFGA